MILDIVIAILLVVSIFYCWKLNSKMQELRKNQSQFAKMINDLDKAILKAESSISELKNISIKTSNLVQEKIDQANMVSDDLEFLTSRAINYVNRFDQHLQDSKEEIKPKKFPEKPIENSQNSVNEPQEKKEKTQAIEQILDRISNMKKRKENPSKKDRQKEAELFEFEHEV